MKKRRVLCVLLVILVACQAAPGTKTPVTPTREIENKGNPPGKNMVVIYEVSGGFAGSIETSVIYDSGLVVTVQQDEMHQYQVAEEEVQELLQELSSLGFWELDETGPESLAPDGADRIVRSLIVYQGDQSKAMQVADGADEPSRLLMQVMAAVQKSIDRAIEE